MQWSCETREKRERGRGRNNSAAAANAACFCEHDNSIDPFLYGIVSMFEDSGLHHHASFSHTHTHTHTHMKCSTSVCWIQHIVFFSYFQFEPCIPDSTAASSVVSHGLQTHHINAATLKWPQLSHKLTADVEVTHFYFLMPLKSVTVEAQS